MVALEEAGLMYEARRLSLPDGAHRTAEFLSLNPKGKVPLLVTDEGALSENLAILCWIDAIRPQAGLLPAPTEPWQRAQALSWLAWSTSTLHPQVYRARMSARIHPDPATHEGIRGAALSEMRQQLAAAEKVLADGRPWLLGEQWCISDAHVSWALGRAATSGITLSHHPLLERLIRRQEARPAWNRMVARETAANDMAGPAPKSSTH
jgi:glutathione S-transferase